MEKLTDEMREYIKGYIAGKLGTDGFSMDITALFGDGSDRKLYRVRYDDESAVFVNNGVSVKLDAVCENDSFDYICRHLRKAGVLTPDIYSYSKEKGWFILEDLGDETLFIKLKTIDDEREVEKLYRRALDVLLTMQIEGIKGFDPNMCYATKYYDKDLILKYAGG
jgi:aminoglycoside/choline kinase family phosphotransferase